MRFERAWLHGVLGSRWAAVVDGRRPRKALANTLRAWLANPATLPNDAPRSRHTQVTAREASPSARAASQVLAASQLLHVSPSSQAPRPATRRHKHRGHPSKLRQASDTHQQRLANGRCTKVPAFHVKCITPAPRRLAQRARKQAAEDNARRRRAERHEGRRSII